MRALSGGDELDRFGHDRPGRERLQGELAGEDVAATVATDVDDQPVLGQELDQTHELGGERVGVLDAEGEDPYVAELTRRRRHSAGPEHTRHL